MKITDIRQFRLSGKTRARWYGLASLGDQDPDQLVPISWIYLEIDTDQGLTGRFGPIQYEDLAFIIDRVFKPALVGKDPLAVEQRWHEMLHVHRHGYAGMYVVAVSALDCALWDLAGRARGEPVWRLLGGPTQTRVTAYASLHGYPTEPEVAAEYTREIKAQGYRAMKWFFRGRARDGWPGLRANLDLAHAARDAAGGDMALMFDCGKGQDVAGAAALARELAAVQPTWLEEPLEPYDLEGYRRLRSLTTVPLATGEHHYTRWDFVPFLQERLLDYIQPDTVFGGGISEMVRIGHMAAVHDVPLVPHGGSVPATLQVLAALPPRTCPWLEYLVLNMERHQHFHRDPIRPVDGCVTLPDRPGLGIELDESRIESREPVRWG